jgi:two-component system nitrogen regulation response regulator GlnG
MPLEAQTRLLRALQSGRVRRVGGTEEVTLDCRIVAATNRDLMPLIAAGQFREDLYYRLAVVPIALPALRERRDDIEALARHFLSRAAAEGLPRRQLSSASAELLAQQPWRGNVRELRNVMFRLALLSRDDVIDVATIESLFGAQGINEPIPPAGMPMGEITAAFGAWLAEAKPPVGQLYDQALAAWERTVFRHALTATGGNQLRAAQLLGINRNTLRKRLSVLSLDPEQFTART